MRVLGKGEIFQSGLWSTVWHTGFGAARVAENYSKLAGTSLAERLIGPEKTLLQGNVVCVGSSLPMCACHQSTCHSCSQVGISARARHMPTNLHSPASVSQYLLCQTNQCYSSEIMFFYSKGRKGTLKKDLILSRILFKQDCITIILGDTFLIMKLLSHIPSCLISLNICKHQDIVNYRVLSYMFYIGNIYKLQNTAFKEYVLYHKPKERKKTSLG